MTKRTTHPCLTGAVALLLCGCMLNGEPAMSETVSPAAIVPLDFLNLVKEDSDWLAGELRAKGLGSGWKIAGGKLMTSDLDVLRYVQRIRSFCYLDRSRTLPYFDLKLEDPSGKTATCVTLYPRDVVPELGVADFRRDTFPVVSLDTEAINACRAPESNAGTVYAGTDRGSYRERFFGKSGELLMASYQELNGDPGFVLHGKELGFHLFRAQLTGYLQMALDK